MTFMTINPYFRSGGKCNFRVTIQSSDMDVMTYVDDEDMQQAVKDNFDYIGDAVREQLEQRLLNLWDKDQITDGQRDDFMKILEMMRI